MTSSITLVSCYVGAVPVWWDYHLLTCRANPDISWLFILVDPGELPPCPENVRVLSMSLEQFERRCSEKLDCPVRIGYPLKMTEIKPFFGHVFAEELVGADFWGFVDIDVFYGRVRHFLPESLLAEADILHSYVHVTGHFTLLRNCSAANQLFRRIPDYQQHLADGSLYHHRIDEAGFELAIQDGERQGLIRRRAYDCSIVNISEKHDREWRKLYEKMYGITLCQTLPSLAKAPVLWSKGRLYSLWSGREGLYYHHQMKNAFFKRLILQSDRRQATRVSRMIIGENFFLALPAGEFFLRGWWRGLTVGVQSLVFSSYQLVKPLLKRLVPRRVVAFGRGRGLLPFDRL